MTDVTLPPYSSFSQASTTLKCGNQFYLERLLKLPRRPMWAGVGGTAVHEATEEWDLNVLTWGEWLESADELKGLFNRHLDEAIASELKYTEFEPAEWYASGRASKEYPNKHDEKWWRDNGPAMLARWANWRMQSPWELATIDGKPAIEIPFEVTMAGVPIKAIADRVFEHNGACLVVDIKSGMHAPDDATQLATYALGIEDQYGVRSDWATFWMARTGSTTAIHSMAKWTRERLEHFYRSTRNTQKMGLLLPKPSNMCSACGVRDYCYAQDGTQADTVPQPWEVNFIDPLDLVSDQE